AVKFTPRDGRVQVQLLRVDSHLEVSVTDTGNGIAAGFLPYVFERFRQSDGSTTRRHGGLGLGLAIVKQLVELHGGTVHATSDGLQSERPDVIVSDIGMPEEDGYTLIRKVRALSAEQGGNVPAVALTAYARTEDRVRAITAGFQHHVAKPVEPSELIAMVASL